MKENYLPEPKVVKSIHFGQSLAEFLAEQAKEENRSFTSMVIHACTKYKKIIEKERQLKNDEF